MNRAFAPMAREQKFDVSEMAIVTYLLAKAYNKPIVLLPAVMFSRFQHNTMVYSRKAARSPCRICRRSASRCALYPTTGVWIRGTRAERLRRRSQQGELDRAEAWRLLNTRIRRASSHLDGTRSMKMLLAGEGRCGDLRRRPAG